MKKTFRTNVLTTVLLAGAVHAGTQESAAILPTGFGPAVDGAVEEVREATAAFRSVEAALAAGYKQETGCIESPPEGAMGYHFTKAELRDGLVEIRKPEVLVFGKRADGTFKLNGAEYIVPLDSWKGTEAPVVMGQPMKRFERAGFFYLHVWIWEPSPSGLFADWNPRVSCPKEPG